MKNESNNSQEVKGIEAFEFNKYTVGEMIDILNRFPKEYQFMLSGEYEYEIWVDHNHGLVSIDNGEFIKKEMEKIKNL